MPYSVFTTKTALEKLGLAEKCQPKSDPGWHLLAINLSELSLSYKTRI